MPYAFVAALLLPLLIGPGRPAGASGTFGMAGGGMTGSPVGRVATGLAGGRPAAKGSQSKQRVTRAVAPPREFGSGNGKNVMAGVILRTEEKPRAQTLVVHRAAVAVFGMNHPLTIPFTGEYHIYRSSSARLPFDSLIQFGTPITAHYVTTNRGAIETEAHQAFEPPIDFTYCSRVEVAVTNKEVTPAMALLRLRAGGKWLDLGPELFGMQPVAEESIAFAVPFESRAMKVDGLTLVFRHDPSRMDESAKVAVQRFTLVPSGM